MSVRYERDTLTEVVRDATSLSEVVERFGGRPTSGSRAYLRRVISSWGIDVSHFRREGVRHTEERLREAVRESTSLAEVVRRLGINPVGGNQAHIGRRVAMLKIDTGHFTAGRKVRRKTRRQTGGLLVLRTPGEGRVPGERLRRAMLRIGVVEACAECGIGPTWNGKPLRLEVDHINGEWWDNRPVNLRLMCPNCHAVTDTFRGRRRRGATA